MKKNLRDAFITHLCTYLGIALVSGSIVHAGTLGGGTAKYIVLIGVGVMLTVVGNYLEHRKAHRDVQLSFIAFAIMLSFGTGMLSGGIQHYLDNPAYSAVLLSLGLIVAFVALAYKDFAKEVTATAIAIVAGVSVVLFVALYVVVPEIFLNDHTHAAVHEH